MAHLGEFVNLVREPRNPYDRNAIRVDNLASQQVCAAGDDAPFLCGLASVPIEGG